ncbi:MAG: ABC transporter ATP-binding protein [Arachnia propionica]|uniref:amino acid ABC transporter ATP-binding/permease protein n=1 Tax=Arachnia propionica TaxID=1750 RepID=UPI0027053A2F|nr:ABC transporter ATP-binding protein [Arachnia propionica]
MNPPRIPELLRWLTGITRPVHAPLAVSTLFRFLNLGLELLLFGLAGWGVAAFASGTSVTGVVGWIVVVALAKAAAYYAEQFTGHYVAFKALELLRGHAFATLWPKAPAVVLRNRSGDLLPTLTRDVDRIEVVYAHTFAPVVSAVVVPTTALLVTGATVGWDIVAIPALCLALALLVVPFLGLGRSLGSTAENLRLRGDLAAHVTDSVFGSDEVVSYRLAPQRLREMDDLGAAIGRASMPPLAFRGLRRAANVVLTLATVTAVIVVGLNTGHDPLLVAGLATASLRLFEGPRGVEDAVGYLDHSLSAARRLWLLCHAPETVRDGERLLEVTHSPGIEWRDVSYSYPGSNPENPALSGVSFHAAPGRRTVLVGRSGSGKSTAVQLLLRYDDPTTGEILIDGVPVGEYTLDSLRRTVVLVTQRAQVIDSTIADNLRLGAPEATDEQLWAALETAELSPEVMAMPQGLATRTGRDGTELSGGQLQRLGLARALLVNPRVLVLDEFTANLDAALETRIRENLERQHPGLTIIEVTHRLDHLGSADQVLTFDRGRLVTAPADRAG